VQQPLLTLALAKRVAILFVSSISRCLRRFSEMSLGSEIDGDRERQKAPPQKAHLLCAGAFQKGDSSRKQIVNARSSEAVPRSIKLTGLVVEKSAKAA
jgi:hypothetical protein